jgi:hypothetical protein
MGGGGGRGCGSAIGGSTELGVRQSAPEKPFVHVHEKTGTSAGGGGDDCGTLGNSAVWLL